MKENYIDLMERTLSAYSREHIERYFADVKRDGLKEHGFPRLTANIGILISFGRRIDLTELFVGMMDLCCESVPRVKAANDFSVKELIFCIMSLEERGGVDRVKTDYWRECLARIVPETCYNVYAVSPTDKVYNWALFTALSEYMRQYAGLCEPSEFIEIQLATQLQWLDENKMYRDPNDPIVYDLVPRGLFSVLLHFGYNGKWRGEIDECLRKTGLLTLRMQSVSGEIPYGGRSNQFLHNEAHFAIVAEYEARRYAREGNMALASAFKKGVGAALENISLWLSREPIRHIKNYYPTETKFGCEDYAYFDKYMITTASFLYAAYLICDDAIPVSDEAENPDAFMLSEHFHKVFMRAGGYFLEFDTNADPHYDSSGLGRVHKMGAPSTVCMSVPCAASPVTVKDEENTSDISLSAGYGCDGTLKFATDRATAYEVISLGCDETSAYMKIKNVFEGGKTVFTDYGLDESGVRVDVRGDGEVAYMLPVFDFDGKGYTSVSVKDNTVEVLYDGWRCVYKSDGKIIPTDLVGCNRNGRYKAYAAKGEGCLSVRIKIEGH